MLEQLVEKLRKYDRVEISYKSGVSIGSVNALLSGANDNPKLSTITALNAFIEEKEKEK